MNTGSKSWWLTNSIGCSEKIEYKLSNIKYQQEMNQIKILLQPTTANLLSTVVSNTTTPEATTSTLATLLDSSNSVTNMSNSNVLENLIQTNCLFPFYTIEIAQSAVLIILGILCIIFGLLLANAFNEDDDTCKILKFFFKIFLYKFLFVCLFKLII
jgi:hypothetical protein